MGDLVGRHGELLWWRGRGQAPHGVLVAVPALPHEVGVLGVLVDVGEARVRLLVHEHLGQIGNYNFVLIEHNYVLPW